MSAGRIVLITGGNRGLGLEVVKQLAEKPDIGTILMGSRDAKSAQQAIEQSKLSTEKVVPIAVDVTDKSSLKSAAEEVKSKYGHLDLLICNAGVASFQHSKEIAHNTMKVNYYGVLDTISAFDPLLKSGSKIIITSSEVGTWTHNAFSGDARKKLDNHQDMQLTDVTKMTDDYLKSFDDESLQKQFPDPKVSFGSYGMSKTLLSTAGRVLGREYKKKGIAVLLACPGYCSTELNGNTGPRSAHQGGESILSADKYGVDDAGALIQDDFVCPIASKRESDTKYRTFKDIKEDKPFQPLKAH